MIAFLIVTSLGRVPGPSYSCQAQFIVSNVIVTVWSVRKITAVVVKKYIEF